MNSLGKGAFSMPQSRKHYSSHSYWLEQCGDIKPRETLTTSIDCDVAVVGAGFTGLWTAYYILEQSPDCRVVVLESETAGFGASGRTGGWCNATMLGLTPAGMVRRWGPRDAAQVIKTMRSTIDEVAEVVDREGIDVNLAKEGVLRVARGMHEIAALDEKYETLRSLGLLDGHRRLGREETLEMIQVNGVEGGLFDPFVYWLHPAKLIRGLAGAVESRGGTIFENSAVLDWTGSGPHRIRTGSGEVSADNVIIATESYSVRFPEFHRRLLPLYSLVVLTEPLTPEQWDRVGWKRRFALSSELLSVNYLVRTPDGRIMFGGRGSPYHYGSKIEDSYDIDERTHATLREEFHAWFPQLHDVRFTHSWGGPIGIPRDWTPNVFFDKRSKLGGAFGYSGQGVAMSNLAGRVLAGSVLDAPTEIHRLPFVGHESRDWEYEPLRSLGVRFVQKGMTRLDARGKRTGKAPSGQSLVERLGRH